jgi:flagellar motor switch protein FliG
MKSVLKLSLLVTAVIVACASAQAAPGKGASGSNAASTAPDALSAKAFIEGLLARRYSLGLATLVDHDSFSLGAQVDLNPVPPAKAPSNNDFDSYNDLMLGSIDSDQLLKIANSPLQDRGAMQKLMDNYRIRNVEISVGLQEDLDSAVKEQVEKWLGERVRAEFGSAGKTFVSFIKKAPKKRNKFDSLEDIFDWAVRNPSLAGQIFLAFAILIGIFVWQLLTKMLGTSPGAGAKQEPDYGSMGSEDSADFASLAQAAKEIKADNDKEAAQALADEDRINLRSGRDIESLKKQLRDLLPRLSHALEDVIRQWCNMGDPGRLRLVCFAEAAFRDTGKLPIPVDALPEVQKVFARMPEITALEKREALEKAYWDLLSTLNLGSDSLSQPFSYMENMSLNMINKVLVDQNPRMQTLVSLHMSKDMRSRYIRSLSPEAKQELLSQATQLNQIPSDELETLDRDLFHRINPTIGNEIVPLEMSFNKIIEGLTLFETITILPKLSGPVVEEFKRNVPSLAFLHEWPDDYLKMLLQGLTPDELVGYLKLRPDLKDRGLALASMMVAEIAKEELASGDTKLTADMEKAIEFFASRLESMVEQGDLSLRDIFDAAQASRSDSPEDKKVA